MPIFVLIVVLGGGLTPKQDMERHALSPGEGFRRSLKNGLLIGLIAGLFMALVAEPIFGFVLGLGKGSIVGPVVGLVVGLFIGLGTPVHYILLRFWLWQSGDFPFRAIVFLEDCRARHLLRRIGGSYQFAHRLVLDYFADLENAVPPAPSATGSTLSASSGKQER